MSAHCHRTGSASAAQGPPLPIGARILTGAFAISGVIHLVRPQVFEAIMPRYLPAHRELVLASGVTELVCAAGLTARRTRRPAGWASVALLLAVFPANVEMARQRWRRWQRRPHDRRRQIEFAATVARLPLQFVMIRDAHRATR